MDEKSKKNLKRIKLGLVKKDKRISEVVRELGISRNAFYLAVERGTRTGKVADWLKTNLGIDLKKTA